MYAFVCVCLIMAQLDIQIYEYVITVEEEVCGSMFVVMHAVSCIIMNRDVSSGPREDLLSNSASL